MITMVHQVVSIKMVIHTLFSILSMVLSVQLNHDTNTIVFSSSTGYFYQRTRKGRINTNVSICSRKRSINGLLSCTCAARNKTQQDGVILYLDKTEGLTGLTILHGNQVPTVVFISNLPQLNSFVQQQGCFFSKVANIFDVKGLAVIYNSQFTTLAREIKYCYKQRNHHVLMKEAYFSYIENSIDLLELRHLIIRVSLSGANVLIIACSPYITTLFTILAVESYSMGNPDFVWIFVDEIPPNVALAPSQSLAIKGTVGPLNYTTWKELMFMNKRLDQFQFSQGHGMDRENTFCSLRENQRTLSRYGSLVQESNRTYQFQVSSLGIRENIINLGTFDISSDLHSIKNKLSELPSHDNAGRVTFVAVIDPPFLFTINKNYVDDYACNSGFKCWEVEDLNAGKFKSHFCCIGLMIDMLLLLEKDLSLRVFLYLVEDQTYGVFDHERQRWSGLVGDLVLKKADMALAPLTVNAERSRVIQYSDSFQGGEFGLLAMKRKRTKSLFDFHFVYLIDYRLWMGVIIMLLISTMGIHVFENNDVKQDDSYHYSQSILFVSSLALQRGIGGDTPSRFTARFFIIFVSMGTLIFASVYTAHLTATQVSDQTVLPISGFYDDKIQNPTSDFTFGTLANTSYTVFFRKSSKASFNRVGRFMEPYNFVDNDEAIAKLKAGDLGAIIHSATTLEYYVANDKECRLALAGSFFPDAGYALAFPKESSLKKTISAKLREYVIEGVAMRLRSKWLRGGCRVDGSNIGFHAERHGVAHFLGLFLCLGVTVAFCVIVHIFMHFSNRNTLNKAK